MNICEKKNILSWFFLFKWTPLVVLEPIWCGRFFLPKCQLVKLTRIMKKGNKYILLVRKSTLFIEVSKFTIWTECFSFCFEQTCIHYVVMSLFPSWRLKGETRIWKVLLYESWSRQLWKPSLKIYAMSFNQDVVNLKLLFCSIL